MMDPPINTSTTKVINVSQKELAHRLRVNGVYIKGEAFPILETELKHGQPPYESMDDFIEQILTWMQKNMSITSLPIGTELATKAIESLREHRRIFVSSNENSSDIDWILIKNVEHNDTNGTSGMRRFNHQYGLLLNELKKLPTFTSGQFQLTTVDQLNTYDSSIEIKCILFAMIKKDPSRILGYLLEDMTGTIPAMFERDPETTCHEFATFSNAIYIAEGSYNATRDTFLIQSIGLPPNVESLMPLARPESYYKDSMIIILSDIHLDKSETIEALKFLFTGYSKLEQVPEIFILMGDFVSKTVDKFDYKDYMKLLIKLIGTFHRLANQSRFVFVPGPNDLGTPSDKNNHICPYFTEDHFPTTDNRIRHSFLASNPFTIQVQGRNLCFYQSPNLIERTLKNVIRSDVIDCQRAPSERNQLLSSKYLNPYITSIGHTIVSSLHLTAGISDSYLEPLSLYPHIPDLILLSDTCHDQYNQVFLYDDNPVQLATMGSFSQNKFQFMCYYVSSNLIEKSQVHI